MGLRCDAFRTAGYRGRAFDRLTVRAARSARALSDGGAGLGQLRQAGLLLRPAALRLMFQTAGGFRSAAAGRLAIVLSPSASCLPSTVRKEGRKEGRKASCGRQVVGARGPPCKRDCSPGDDSTFIGQRTADSLGENCCVAGSRENMRLC